MTSALFVALDDPTQLYNVNAKPRETVPKGQVLECDTWVWDKGGLLGMRKVYSPSVYENYFVKDSDLSPYNTDPPPDADNILYSAKDLQLRVVSTGEVYENTEAVTFRKTVG